MIKKDISTSIAAGEALLFLENSSGSVSIKDFDQFLRSTGTNVYLILHLLLSENLIFITRHDEDGPKVMLNRQELILFSK